MAECLEVRARLRVRRCMLGEAAAVTGVRGGLREVVGVRREGKGEEEGGFVGVVGGGILVGGECGSG